MFILFPFLFVIIGISFITGVLVSISEKKKIAKYGHRYAAKIYRFFASIDGGGGLASGTDVHPECVPDFTLI